MPTWAQKTCFTVHFSLLIMINPYYEGLVYTKLY